MAIMNKMWTFLKLQWGYNPINPQTENIINQNALNTSNLLNIIALPSRP